MIRSYTPSNGFDRAWTLNAGSPLAKGLLYASDTRFLGPSLANFATGYSGEFAFDATLPPSWTTTPRGPALEFAAATNDRCLMASPIPTGSSYTLVFWLFPSFPSDNNNRAILDNGYLGTTGIRLFRPASTSRVKIQNDYFYNGVGRTNATDIPFNQLYCLAVTSDEDAEEHKLYINGVDDSGTETGDGHNSYAKNGYNIGLGWRHDTSTSTIYSLIGQCSFTGIWNRVLSDAEVWDFYASTINGGPGGLARSTRRLWAPSVSGEPPAETFNPQIFMIC
jgi:hypothetical protein